MSAGAEASVVDRGILWFEVLSFEGIRESEDGLKL